MKRKINDRHNLDFRVHAKKCLSTLVVKVIAKSPIKSSLVRAACCLNPVRMASHAEDSSKKLKALLTNFVSLGRVAESKCDVVIKQYRFFLDRIVARQHGAFLDFKTKDTRLDDFLKGWLSRESVYEDLYAVMKLVLVLSHGQATVERGFSVNKQITVENKKECTYHSQRLLIDTVRDAGGSLNITITTELIVSCKSARIRYEEYLKYNESRKRKRPDELTDLKSACKQLHCDIEHLQKESDNAADEAEKSRDWILKFNCYRKSMRDKKSELEKVTLELNKKKKAFS